MSQARRQISIVKLGGSLARSERLTAWLDSLAEAAGEVVVVPGGGPFAERVREMQQRWRFGDPTAHRLALLAMEQFGRMLAALRPGLAPAESRAAIRRALRDGRVPVWMPTAMVLGRPEIAQSWEVTSDSLALWLAGEIGARRVILVKSAPAPGGPLLALDLARRGLVDPAFPAFLEKSRCEAFYTGPEQGENYARAVLHSPRIGGPRGGRRGTATARDHGE